MHKVIYFRKATISSSCNFISTCHKLTLFFDKTKHPCLYEKQLFLIFSVIYRLFSNCQYLPKINAWANPGQKVTRFITVTHKKINPNKVEHFNMSIKCAFVPRKKVAHFQTHNTQHYSDHEFQLKL